MPNNLPSYEEIMKGSQKEDSSSNLPSYQDIMSNKMQSSPPVQTQDVSNIQPDLSEVSPLEAIARGGGQGASFGFSEEALAAAQAAANKGDYSQLYNQYLQSQRAREKQAAEEHPILYHGSELLGGLAVPFGALKGLKALGLVGEAANAARELSPLAKVGESIALGTGFGGLTGAGKSEGKNIGEVAKDAASSAALGGLISGTLTGGIEGTKALSRLFAERGGIGSEIAKSAVKGFDENVSIRNIEELKNNLYNEAEKFGNTAIKDQIQGISSDMANAIKLAEETGEPINVDHILDRLNKLRTGIEETGSPRARKEFADIAAMVEDKLQGIPQSKMVSIPTSPEVLEEAVPSAQEQLENQASKLQEQSDVLGENAKYKIVDKDKNKYLLKILRNEAGEESPSIAGKLPNVEASPEVQYSPLERQQVQVRPGKDVMASDVKGLESELGNEIYNPKLGINSVEANNAAKELDQLVTDTTNKSVPGYEVLRDKYKNLTRAMQALGISKDELFTFTPEGERVISPDAVASLGKYLEKSLSSDVGSVAKEKHIQDFLTYLSKAGVKDPEKQMDAVMKAAENLKLGKYIGGSTVNPLFSAKTMLKSGAYTGNLLGQAERNIISPTLKKLIPVLPLSDIYQDTAKGLQPMNDLDNKPVLGGTAQALKASPTTSYLGENLQKALNSGSRISQAAAINAISQNPNARKTLKGK